MPDLATPSFSTARRWRIGSNVFISTLALLAIVVMANYLASRHFKRCERQLSSRRELSPVTLRILQTLTNKVKVVVLFSHRSEMYEPVRSLLHKYSTKSPQIEVEDVDYERYIGRAKQVLAELKQEGPVEDDRVIFSANGRTKVVHEGELSEYANAAQEMMEGKEINRTGFRGEQLFTAAIFSVSDPKPMKAYFLQGHSEHDPADDKESSIDGYAEFARLLQDNNLSYGELSLDRAEVPEDCQLLIVAGARKPVSSLELERIDRYLTQGGRLFLLFNWDSLDNRTGRDLSGLVNLAMKWGVDVGQNVVFDMANDQAGSRGNLLISDFGSHPVVNPLRRSRLGLIWPRTVKGRTTGTSGADAPNVKDLLLTSNKAITARKTPEGAAVTDRNSSTHCLAVAVEKGTIQGINTDRGTTRMVIVGDSFFLGNGKLGINNGANRDFARNALNWLLSRDVFLQGIVSQPLEEYQIRMTQREMRTAQWLLLAVLPGSVLFLGWLVWLRRRS
ncbi:MAG: GldG family protein [Verrucomicrobiales bacterium]|nr:GldG family protein [Verrucomicrobiales bacterium]